MIHPTRFVRRATALLFAAFALIGSVAVNAQAIFTVINVAPILSTGASVSITAPNAIFQISGAPANNITPLTFGTDIEFLSTAAGSSNPGFSFNGSIGGSPSIPASTLMPISYSFTLGKNESIANTVNWTLTFVDNVNTTPILVGSGALTAVGAASQAFSGVYGNYSFTGGSPATFTASLNLSYNTGIPSVPPLVTITMANTGFGGGGITLNASAIPEPSTYAAIAGAAVLGFAVWQRRRRSATVA